MEVVRRLVISFVITLAIVIVLTLILQSGYALTIFPIVGIGFGWSKVYKKLYPKEQI
jgi:hypothetical protein